MNRKILDQCHSNLTIFDAMAKILDVIPKYKKVTVSISGGADSDIIIDMIERCQFDTQIDYIWFNTGLEYQATKEHLDYLEKKYNVEIKRCKPKKPIPLAVREYGVPFLNKYTSAMIARLQRHQFKFEDKSFEELYKEYPKCKVPLKWWTDSWFGGRHSSFNISRNKWLKEFLVENPPTFKISDKCCYWTKKKTAFDYLKENDVDLNIVGLRKSEGGIRAAAFKTCFEHRENQAAYLRPIFWFKNSDKEEYEALFDVTHSRCYTEYGMTRTGCAGCPYSRTFEKDLEIIKKYEPKLYKAVNNIFGQSFEYTRKFIEFKKMKEKENER